MANLIETDRWEEGIYQWEEDDPVLGGPSGIDNVPPRQLANRSRYQRLRNVTAWVATFDYPADAYVAWAGTTWKSIAPSLNIAPGTDATRWVRWGHTAKELSAALGDSVAAHEERSDPHPVYAFRDVFAAVPKAYVGHVITVSTPHLRQLVWNGTTYVRAPWHQPGMVLYSYDNPASISGYLPVRADVSYSQANYPDLVARLGLSGTGTFTLIELRGEFIRCLDNGRGVDAGRGLRSAQAGDNQSHAHNYADPTHSHYVNDPTHGHPAWTDQQGHHGHYLTNMVFNEFGAGSGFPYVPGNLGIGGKSTDGAGSHAHNVGVGGSGTGIWLSASGTGIAIQATGSEARPRNVALPAWISY
ncbi:hypothetical protein [Variovorax sp. YR216]|uniref:hypothetical protein n=1 Tax=Variovorax sp. YR216 TaxID=1882828 RepID=UPI00089B12DE|nr:hypothetical protein [Variovorax sp. YR216]SEA50463.1 hypothetical protein SAMN05444680_102682 [Variovorax sp. YR216]